MPVVTRGNIGGADVGRFGGTAHPSMPCRFRLYRFVDASGVSGTGTVAWGTVYPNGKVSLAWCGTRPSINVYESLADVEAIHGHDGRTRIIMCDEPLPSGVPNSIGW